MAEDNLEQRVKKKREELRRLELKKKEETRVETPSIEVYHTAIPVSPVKKSRERLILEAMSEQNYVHLIDEFYGGSLDNTVSGIQRELKEELRNPVHRHLIKNFSDYIISLTHNEPSFEKQENILKSAIRICELDQTSINHAAETLRQLYISKCYEAESEGNIRKQKIWLSKFSNVRNLYTGI